MILDIYRNCLFDINLLVAEKISHLQIFEIAIFRLSFWNIVR